jgi:hypothetical protein
MAWWCAMTYSAHTNKAKHKYLGCPYHQHSRTSTPVVPTHNTYIQQVCIQIFKERGHEVDYKVGLPKEELLKIIPQYDGKSFSQSSKQASKQPVDQSSQCAIVVGASAPCVCCWVEADQGGRWGIV